MKTVFVINDYSGMVVSIHATREGAEKAFKEYTEGKSQEWIDDYWVRVYEKKLKD